MTLRRLRSAPSAAPGIPVIRGDLLGYRPKLVLLPGLLADRSLTYGFNPALNGGLVVRGAALDFDGTDDYIDLGSGGLAADSAHTVVAVANLRSFNVQYPVLFNYLTTGGGGRRKLFFSKYIESGYADITFGLHADSGGGTAGWSLTPGQASGGSGVLGVDHSMVVRCAGTTTAAYEMWRAGRKLSRAGLAQGTNAQTGLNCVGRSSTNDASNHLDGLVKLLVVFDAILPDGLCQELSANPWSMFTTERLRGVAAAGGALTGAGTEAATAAESPSASLASLAAAAESGTASDNATASATAQRAAIEAASAADSTSAVAAGNYAASATEPATSADASTASTAAAGAATEAATAVDSAAATGQFAVAATEAATASDAGIAAAAGNYTAAVSEAATAADSAPATFAASCAAVEVGSAADGCSAALAAAAAALETAAATDASTGLPSGAYAAAAQEPAPATDSAAAVATLAAAAAEPAAASDSAASVRASFASVLETATPIDVGSAVWASTALPVFTAAPSAWPVGAVSARVGSAAVQSTPARVGSTTINRK